MTENGYKGKMERFIWNNIKGELWRVEQEE